ncbi:MAG: hypothetical protein ACXWVT_12785, partial [Burkholderiaceae bacterium]
MRLENRPPAEGINSSTDNPLKELAWLLGGSLAVVIALAFTISLAAQWIAPRIPYKYEARLAATLPALASAPATEPGRAVQRELQALADRLSARMQLPEGMQVRVGYADSKTINAFAISLAAQWIAPRIPYKYEARLAATLPALASAPATEPGRAVQRELQALADRLSARMQLPEGMQVRV